MHVSRQRATSGRGAPRRVRVVFLTVDNPRAVRRGAAGAAPGIAPGTDATTRTIARKRDDAAIRATRPDGRRDADVVPSSARSRSRGRAACGKVCRRVVVARSIRSWGVPSAHLEDDDGHARVGGGVTVAARRSLWRLGSRGRALIGAGFVRQVAPVDVHRETRCRLRTNDRHPIGHLWWDFYSWIRGSVHPGAIRTIARFRTGGQRPFTSIKKHDHEKS